MELNCFFRASAAVRVKIALNMKHIPYRVLSQDLGAKEYEHLAYVIISPPGLVPALECHGNVLSQSLTIIEYLEDCFPEPRLFPAAPLDRARVKGLIRFICADMHPLGTERVAQYLQTKLRLKEEAVSRWQQHWIYEGMHKLEHMLKNDRRTGTFCQGNSPGAADIFLAAQAVTAVQSGVDLAIFPTISGIVDECQAVPAFESALSEMQLDHQRLNLSSDDGSHPDKPIC